jgi:prepilin peptidase dependent protein B
MRGLSLVELLVGITLGIFLIGGAMTMLMTNLTGSQKLLIEARVNQDLRAVVDLIARDLKRSGYWGNSISGAFTSSSSTNATSNPYSSITCTSCITGTSTTSQLVYGYTKDSTENNTLDSNEQFGFRLSSNKIQMQTASGTWQDVTDPNILSITALTILETKTSINVSAACVNTPSSNLPSANVRKYDITVTGQAVSDSSVVRTLQTTVRIRNDQMTGACP